MKWYQKDYRRVFMDMHLNDTKPDEYLSQLDPQQFVDTLAQAGATSVVVKAKSHVGLHYWKSSFGRMHEGLRRKNLDYVQEMTQRAHNAGLNVIVYFSQIFDNYAYEHYPEWRMVDSDGRGYRDRGERYGLICPNHVGYRAYAAQILTELVANYQFEGMFLDMPFWPMVCCCDACKARFLRETGHMLPCKEDWEDPVWCEFVKRRQEWMAEFALSSTQVIKSVNPNVCVEHNLSALGAGWESGDTEALFEASDYAGGDYYGGYLQQSFMCKYYNSMTKNKPFCYITSRCDADLFNHTVSRTEQDLLIHAVNAMVHNGAFSVCDAMNPNGTFNADIYRHEIRNVFQTIQKMEPYVSGNMIADVAILYDTEFKAKKTYIDSPMNVAKAMCDRNIPFNVIGCKNLKQLCAQVLCINDVPLLSDKAMDDIEAYVMRGGRLFVTGQIGNRRLERLLGVSTPVKNTQRYTYLTPKASSAHLFKSFTPQSPLPIKSAAWETVRTEADVEILATLSYPYTLPEETDFAAIHSDPPGFRSENPAVTKRAVGKGCVLWVCAPIELATAHHCRNSMADLICSLLAQQSFASNVPAFCEVVGWRKEEKSYYAVINQQEETPVYPLENIWIELPYVPKAVRNLTGEAVRISVEGNRARLYLPTLEIFQVLEVAGRPNLN